MEEYLSDDEVYGLENYLSDDEVYGGSEGFTNENPPGPKDRTALDIAKDSLVTVGKGVVGTGESAVGLLNLATLGGAGKALDYVGYDPKQTQKILSSLYSEQQQEANKTVEEAKGFIGTGEAMLENPSTIYHGALETIPSMLGGGALARTGLKVAGVVAPRVMAGAAATKWGGTIAGAAGEGLIGAGGQAEQMRQELPDKELTTKQAGLAALSGVGTAAFGVAGGSLAKKLGIVDVDTWIATGGKKVAGDVSEEAKAAGWKQVIGKIIGGGISEGVFEEMPQTAQETILYNAAMDRPLLEGVPEGIAKAGIIGGAMGMAGGGMSSLPQENNPELEAAKAKFKDAATVDEVLESAAIIQAERQKAAEKKTGFALAYELDESDGVVKQKEGTVAEVLARRGLMDEALGDDPGVTGEDIFKTERQRFATSVRPPQPELVSQEDAEVMQFGRESQQYIRSKNTEEQRAKATEQETANRTAWTGEKPAFTEYDNNQEYLTGAYEPLLPGEKPAVKQAPAVDYISDEAIDHWSFSPEQKQRLIAAKQAAQSPRPGSEPNNAASDEATRAGEPPQVRKAIVSEGKDGGFFVTSFEGDNAVIQNSPYESRAKAEAARIQWETPRKEPSSSINFSKQFLLDDAAKAGFESAKNNTKTPEWINDEILINAFNIGKRLFLNKQKPPTPPAQRTPDNLAGVATGEARSLKGENKIAESAKQTPSQAENIAKNDKKDGVMRSDLQSGSNDTPAEEASPVVSVKPGEPFDNVDNAGNKVDKQKDNIDKPNNTPDASTAQQLTAASAPSGVASQTLPGASTVAVTQPITERTLPGDSFRQTTGQTAGQITPPISKESTESGGAEQGGEDKTADKSGGKKSDYSPEFPLNRVKSSYDHTSNSPGNAASLEKGWYEESAKELRDILVKEAGAEKQGLIDGVVTDFKKAYLEKRERVWLARSITVSSHIAGGSKFNSKQAERRGNALDRAQENFTQWENAEKERIFSEMGVTKAREEKKRRRAEAENVANETLKAREIKQRAANRKLPIVNSKDNGAVGITSEEWAKLHADYKIIQVSEDGTHRLRSAMLAGHSGLSRVYLTDKPITQPDTILKKTPEAKISQTVIKGSEKDSPKLSTAPLPPSQQATLEELTGAQRRLVKRLEALGILRISDKPPNDTTQAMYLNGVVNIYPKNIEKDNLFNVIVHDVGEHVGSLLQGNRAYRRLLGSIEARKDEQSPTGKAVRAAIKRIPKNTRPQHYNSEILGYLVEMQADVGIVRRFIALIKDLIVKMGANVNIFTAADLRALAEAAVRREARGGKKGVKRGYLGGETEFAQPAMMSVKEAARNIQGMEAFKKWFGGSKVLDDKGKPLVVYHGTDRNISEFRTYSSEMGAHFGTSGQAEAITGGRESQSGQIYPAYLQIKNPLRLKDAGAFGFSEVVPQLVDMNILPDFVFPSQYSGEDGIRAIHRALTKEGYDGIVYLNRREGLEVRKEDQGGFEVEAADEEFTEKYPDAKDSYIVFEPTQIKSVFNPGLWDGTNPDIMKSVRSTSTPDERNPPTIENPLSPKNLQEVVSTPGLIRYIQSKKVDSSFLHRVFSTPEYYFKKFAAAGRVLQAALLRRDVRFVKETEILGGFVKTIQALRKTNKRAYTEANDYLVETDQQAEGFRIKTTDSGKFQVFAPQWAVILADGEKFTKEKSIVGEFEPENDTPEASAKAEKEAVTAMINAEMSALEENGYSQEAIAAIREARELTNRGFDVMAEDMRAIIAEAKENGLPSPFIGDGNIDEAGRYGVYAAGKPKPIALFASEKEAGAFLDQAAEMISYMVYSQKKGTRTFNNELKARKWAARHSGTVKGEKAFQNLTVKKRSNADMRPLTVKEALAQMGDLRGIYFPRIRESGEFVLIAKKEGENPIRKHFDIPVASSNMPGLKGLIGNTANWTMAQIGRVIPNAAIEAKRLSAQGYEVTISRDTSPADDLFNATNLMTSVDAMLQTAMGTVDANSEADLKSGQNINQILTMQIADIFKSRGYLSSRMRRLTGDVVWEGYEKDMGKALTQYGKNVAAGTAKRDTARAMILAFTGRDYSWNDYKKEIENPSWEEYKEIVEQRRIDEKTQKNLFRDVRSFMVDVLRNDEQADRIIGTMKGLAVLKYLGFRVSSAAVNMTNLVQGVPATISGLTGESLTRSARRILSAATAYGKHRSGKGGLSAEDKAIFQYISEKGWDEAQFNQEAASELRGKLGEGWNKFIGASMFMFGAAEKANRAITIFAAYKAVREQEKTADESVVWEKAKEISDRAHGIYGKETIPAWARGKYNPLRLSYTFQKFSHNYMLNMLDIGFNQKEYKAAAYMLLSPAILAGAGASLAGPALFALAGALGVGGDDPEEEFYKWAENTFGGGTFARHGAFGLAGINVKGSLSMSLPMPTDIGKLKLADLAGPSGGIISDTAKGFEHISRGEFFKGVESLLPTAFGSMSKAYRESTEGITTSNYGSVFYGDEPLKATEMDAILRFFSFNPSRISGIREMQRNEEEVAAKYQKKKTDIYSEIKRLHIQGKKITPEIMKEISVYNQQVRDSGRRDLNKITTRDVATMLKRSDRASKVERLRRMHQ